MEISDYPRSSLSRTVYTGFTLLIVLTLVSAVITFWAAQRLREDSRWVEQTLRVEVTLKEIAKLLVDAETGQRGYLYTEREIYLEPYNNALGALPAALLRLEESAHDENQRANLGQLKPLVNERLQLLARAVSMVEDGKPADAKQFILSNQGKNVMDKIRGVLTLMDDRQEQLLAARKKRADQAALVANVATVVSPLLLVMAALFFVAFLRGNIISTLKRVVQSLAATTAELAAATEEHEAVAVDQAAAVAQTSATTEELNASFRQVSEQAENALTRASGALGTADAGIEKVQRTVSGVSELEARVRAVGEQSARLNDHTQQIGSITAFVTEVANQTNMLALNAAVEAARAGEHGRGFGVVASEIRKLAEQSKTSASRIASLVGDTQQASRLTAEASEEGVRTAIQVADLTRETTSAFESISQAMRSVLESTQQASLNVRQQMMAIQQVAEAMTALQNGSRQTSAGVSQTREGLRHIKVSAQEIRQIL